MKHELSDFVDQQFRSEFERGRVSKGYQAALFCVANGVPIPRWLASTVEDALKHDAMCPTGRGKGKSYPTAESAAAVDRNFILSEVDRLAPEQMSKRDAFEIVARDLDRHRLKAWTAEMVKTEYYRNR